MDVASDASFMLDNLVLTPVDMDAETEFSYEFDEMTFVTYPSWMDKPFVNGALPADVTDGKAIFASQWYLPHREHPRIRAVPVRNQ